MLFITFTDSRSASINTEEYYTQSQQSLNVSGHDLSISSHHTDRRASTSSTTSQQHSYPQLYYQHQHQPYNQQPSSNQQNVTPSAPDRKQDPNYAARLAALPAYRHTPDYATVMRQKMNQSQQPTDLTISQHSHQNIHDLNQNIANTHIYAQSEEGLAYSQPEISSHGNSAAMYNHSGHYNLGSPTRSYPHSVSMYTDVFASQGNYLQFRDDRQTNLVMQPTYSSPELNTQGLPQSFMTENFMNVNEAYVYHYKPPPPYPRASNSTPDLAVQTYKGIVSNSPDLVSRKTLGDAIFTLENQSRLENSVESVHETIPEVIQISENTVETETGISEVGPCPQEVDDASSDHSNSTFHVKEIDSEPEETFVRSVPQRKSSKSKIQVRFVAPNKIPPPSASKDVATRRESFRRMMIARSGSFTPGVLQAKSDRIPYANRSLRERQSNIVNEYVKDPSVTYDKPLIADDNDPIKQNVKNVLSRVTEQSTSLGNRVHLTEILGYNSPNREVMRSQSDANKPNKVPVIHEKAVSVDSSTERQQILDRLKSTEPEVPTISENANVIASRERLVDYEDSSESDQVDNSVNLYC